MRSTLPFLIFALVSCGGLTALAPEDDDGDDTGLPDGEADADTDSDSDSDTDADSDADTDGDIAIDTVQPSTGSSAGGDEITITGGPFDGDTRIWFGSGEGTVSGWGSTQLLVESPSGSGTVDVSVETGTGETGRKASAFTYITDNSNKAGVIGELYWTEMVGGYWETPSEWGGAYMWFIQPEDVHFWQLYTSSLDSCINGDDFGTSLSFTVYDPGLSTVSITSTTGQAISMSYDSATGAYSADDIAASKYIDNGWYTLGDMSSSSVVPTDEVEFFTRGAARFNVTQPMISGTNPPNIQKAQTVVWSGATGDWVVIYASMRDASAAAEADSVYCVAKNDGSFQIEQTKWKSWTTGRIVDLFVMASREEGATLTHDNSDSRVVGTYIMYGAGYSQ